MKRVKKGPLYELTRRLDEAESGLDVLRQQVAFATQEPSPEVPAILQKSRLACPHCGGGVIAKRGVYGLFIGCANFSPFGCRWAQSR